MQLCSQQHTWQPGGSRRKEAGASRCRGAQGRAPQANVWQRSQRAGASRACHCLGSTTTLMRAPCARALRALRIVRSSARRGTVCSLRRVAASILRAAQAWQVAHGGRGHRPCPGWRDAQSRPLPSHRYPTPLHPRISHHCRWCWCRCRCLAPFASLRRAAREESARRPRAYHSRPRATLARAGGPRGARAGAAEGRTKQNELACLYEGRSESDDGLSAMQLAMQADPAYANKTRGCIIGGTALVDPAILGRRYPHNVRRRPSAPGSVPIRLHTQSASPAYHR